VQGPNPAGTFVEVRLQQQSAIVIHQVAQRRVQVLPCRIDQLGTVVCTHIGRFCKALTNETVLVYKDLARVDIDQTWGLSSTKSRVVGAPADG
jgi:hypothetical protein